MKSISVNNHSQILTNVTIGKEVKIYNFVNAYDCQIGDGSRIGSFVEIQKGAIIGKNCKISSHSFICEGVHIADNVFVGHNVTFINDKLPRATNEQGDLLTDADWTCIDTYDDKGASIGSGATILCGIRIGRGAMIGAGSVVTHDVDDEEVVAGNPARRIRQLNTNPA